MTVHAPLCDEHRYHWTWRGLFIWLGFAFFALLGILCLVALAAQERQRGAFPIAGLLCFGTAMGGLAWLIAAAIIQQVGIRPTEITDRSITLANVSPSFVRAVREERALREEEGRSRRRPRRRSRDEEEETR
jgi:hypothetical protein